LCEGDPNLMGTWREQKDTLVKQARFDRSSLVGKDITEPGHNIEIRGLLDQALAQRSLSIGRIAGAQGGYCLFDGEPRQPCPRRPRRFHRSHVPFFSRAVFIEYLPNRHN